MHPFHKTSYSRPSKHTKLLHSVQEAQLKGYDNPQRKEEDIANNCKISQVVNKKLEIDSKLLFNNKTHYFKKDEDYNRVNNKSQAKQYDTAIGFPTAKDRPQSKQESRHKMSSSFRKKQDQDIPERPQTSKGGRSYQSTKEYVEDVKQRKLSLENEQEGKVVIIKNNKKSVTGKKVELGKFGFETSIDPEFLALFAN